MGKVAAGSRDRLLGIRGGGQGHLMHPQRFSGRQGQLNDAIDFHLLQSFETRRELPLAIGHGPVESRTDRSGNGTLGGTPRIIRDATNRLKLGLGERTSPIPERRSSGVAAYVVHAPTLTGG